MKLLFIGLGSIGRRHLLNITSELETRGKEVTVDALRHDFTPLDDAVKAKLNHVYGRFDQLEAEYDAVFITNPSSEHYGTLKQITGRAKAVFIEKPVFSDPLADIGSLRLKPDGIYYVACPLRFSPVIKRVADLLTSYKPTAVRAICSSYLPEWRKTQNYSNSYSAHSDRGGGVRLDLIHEWDYLTELFGTPLSVKSEWGQFSDLKIQSEDTAVYIARYPDMLLTLHLDFSSRANRRSIELICENETIVADIINNEIFYLNSKTGEKLPETDIHREEINRFLDLLDGKAENINPIKKAVETLKLALA